MHPKDMHPTGSSAARLEACPGSYALESRLPDKSRSDSDEGTLIHRAYAGELVELTEGQEWVISEAHKIEEALGAQVFGDRFWSLEPVIEKRLSLVREDYTTRTSGAIDRYYIDEESGSILLLDLKSLYGDHPPAWKNKQVKFYAALLSWNYPWARRVYAAIIQPRRTKEPDLALFEDLSGCQRWALDILDRVESSDATRNPGKHCEWCKAKVVCREWNQWSNGLTISDENIWIMSADERSEFYRDAKKRIAMLESVTQQIAELGRVAPELVNAEVSEIRGRRYAKSSYDVVKALVDSSYISGSDAWEFLDINFSKMEKIFARKYKDAHRHDGTKLTTKGAVDHLFMLIDEHVERSQSKAKLELK